MPPNPITLGLGVQIDQQSARDALGVLSRFTDSFRFGSEWLKPAEELEHVTERMSAAMGGGRTAAVQLRSEIFSLAETTLFGTAKIADYESAFLATGQSIGTFTDQTAQSIVHLGETFGVAGADMARVSAESTYLGSNLDALLGDATSFTKRFGLPGMFSALPELVSSSRRAVLEFGRSVVGSGRQVIASTMNVAGVFSKAFGVSVSDALGRATGALDQLRTSARQDADVFLGLSKEFSGLTLAIVQSGAGIERSMQIVRRAGEGDLSSLEELIRLRNRLPSQLMRDRFTRQLQKELPQDLFALVDNVEALRSALDMKAEADRFAKTIGGQGVQSFLEIGDSMRDTTVAARDMFNNVMDLGKALFTETGLTRVFQDALKNTAETMRDLSASIRQFMKSDQFRDVVATWQPVLGKIASAALAASMAIGALGTVVAGKTTIAIAKFAGQFTGLSGVFSAVGGVIGKIVGRVGPLGLLYAKIRGIEAAVTEMGAVLGDPNATGAEKFEAILFGMGKGIGKFFDTILLGIPGKIVDVFFPNLERKFELGVASLFSPSEGKQTGTRIYDTLFGWVSNLNNWLLRDAIPQMKSWAGNFSKNLGSIVGGAVRDLGPYLWEGLKFAFRYLSPVGLIYGLFTGSDVASATTEAGSEIGGSLGTELLGSLVFALGGLGEVILEAGKQAATGFIEAFGATPYMLELMIRSEFARISGVWAELGHNWTRQITRPFEHWTESVGFWWADLATNSKSLVAKVGESISGGFDWAWGRVKVGAYDLAASVAGVFERMSLSIIDNLSKLVSAFPNWVPGIESMTNGLNIARHAIGGLGQAVREEAEAENAAQIEESRRSDARIDEIERVREAELAATEERRRVANLRFREQLAADDAESLAQKRQREAGLEALQEEFNREALLNSQRQQRATDERRLNKTSKSLLDAALEEFSATASKQRATDETTRSGADALKTYMREQTATIAKEVAAGAITAEQAADRLKQAAATGLEESKQKLRARTAGEVSDAARGPGPAGLTQEAHKSLWDNIRRDMIRAKQKVSVDVTLNGGDALSKALARNARQANVSATG